MADGRRRAGRRIEKNVNGALTRYVYDDDAILLEYDGANALLATYSHGEEVVSPGPLPQGPRGAAGAGSKIRRRTPGAIPPRGRRRVGGRTTQPLAMTRGGGSYFYHTDHLGSVRLVTDASGAVANRYDYDAFGNLEATSFETVSNPFGFTARERDAESGLMFYRARTYDPKLGRFISEDPIGFEAGDLNVYRYALNEPISFTDPSGLDTKEEGGLYMNAADTADVLYDMSGLVNCGFFTLGSIVGAVNAYMTAGATGTFILGLDPNACGVIAEMTPLMKGIKAHDAFNAAFSASGFLRDRVVFDGSLLRPDLAHPDTESCVELKPLTKSGQKTMTRQTFKYRTTFRRLSGTAAGAFSNAWECIKVFYYWAE